MSVCCVCAKQLSTSLSPRFSSALPHAAVPRATALTPFSEALKIPKNVWDAMGPLAQATAAAAGNQRAALSGLPLLQQLGDALPAAQASALGVTVLHSDGDGNVSVGLFDLPKLENAVQSPPKSE
jgi:hypothetical protein